MIRDPARELLARRRAAAERLRREVQRMDGSLGHPYLRAYRRHVRTYRRASDRKRLLAACERSRLVYVGDFHALPSYTRFAGHLLADLHDRVEHVGLGVEFVYTRQQPWLDARQRGELSDEEFLRRIHYREEWGYPWEGLRDLLDEARRREIEVFALDSSPRAGLGGVRRRDDHAARRVTSILADHRRLRLVVLFGESHLAPGHLPAKVGKRCERAGLRVSATTVFQNPDAVYWDLAVRRERLPEAVRIDDRSWAVLHASPLEKYEAHRQVLARWSEDVPDDGEVDLTPAVHHLIGVLLGWLGIRPHRRIRHRAGWVDELADAFPDVYGGAEAAALLPAILAEHGRTAEEVREARAMLRERGALYESRSNVLFLRSYLPGRAAGEAARFLRAALTGRLFVPSERSDPDPAVRAYGAAYNEALAYLGSRLVDPASDYLSGEDLGAVRPRRGERLPPARERRVRWIEAHRQFEESRERCPTDSLLAPLRERRRTARVHARDLGHRLGRILYRRVRAGQVTRANLRSWFTRPLPPHRAIPTVIGLLRGA